MHAPFKLRPYQQEAVDATLSHFRKSDESAVIVLPTGAGKSLVIAELARLARRRILVLTHVKELVEQNHAKYQGYGLTGGIFSAGLKRKESRHQVTFASVQSVAANLEQFRDEYSLVIIDECHRVSGEETSQYRRIIELLRQQNESLKVLGLTATPYRLAMGWIYRFHYRGFVRGDEDKPFQHCIYELPLSYMINRGYLTRPELVNAAVVQYDFSTLARDRFGEYAEKDVNQLLGKHKRVTRAIIEQVMELAEDRHGAMIFAATVDHAREITGYLPENQTALVTGGTDLKDRDLMIQRFKQRQLKYPKAIIDPDDQLRDALKLKDAMVIRCAGIALSVDGSKLRITYHGEDGEELSESFDFSKRARRTVFNRLFGRRFANSQAPKTFSRTDEVLEMQAWLPAPDFVIARKQKHYWQVQERIFDYQGSYRKANEA